MPWASGAIFVLSLSTSDHKPSCGHRGPCRRRQPSHAACRLVLGRPPPAARRRARVLPHASFPTKGWSPFPARPCPRLAFPRDRCRCHQVWRGGAVQRRECLATAGQTRSSAAAAATRIAAALFFFFLPAAPGLWTKLSEGGGGDQPWLGACFIGGEPRTARGNANREGAARLATASCWDARPPPPSQSHAVLIPPAPLPCCRSPPSSPIPHANHPRGQPGDRLMVCRQNGAPGLSGPTSRPRSMAGTGSVAVHAADGCPPHPSAIIPLGGGNQDAVARPCRRRGRRHRRGGEAHPAGGKRGNPAAPPAEAPARHQQSRHARPPAVV